MPILAIFIFAAASLSPNLFAAATFYLAPNGNDQNPGTAARPFQTFAKAMAAATPGDTILFQPGIYPGGMTITKSGKPDQPITIRGAENGQTVIKGRFREAKSFAAVPERPGLYAVASPDKVLQVAVDLDRTPLIVAPINETVTGLDAVAAGNYRMFYDPKTAQLYLRYDGSNPETNRTLHLFYDENAFTVNSGVHDVIIDGFTLSHFVSGAARLHRCRNVTVRDCRMFLAPIAGGYGAVTLDQTEACRIEHCTLYRVMTAIALHETRDTVIVHNTIYRTRAHGIILYHARGTVIKNNILWAGGRSGNALYMKQSEIDLTLDFNCYFDDAGPLVYWGPTASYFPTFWDYRAAVKDQDRHSFSADPLFVSTDVGAEDLRLQSRSPCKGKADDRQDIGASSRMKQEEGFRGQ